MPKPAEEGFSDAVDLKFLQNDTSALLPSHSQTFLKSFTPRISWISSSRLRKVMKQNTSFVKPSFWCRKLDRISTSVMTFSRLHFSMLFTATNWIVNFCLPLYTCTVWTCFSDSLVWSFEAHGYFSRFPGYLDGWIMKALHNDSTRAHLGLGVFAAADLLVQVVVVHSAPKKTIKLPAAAAPSLAPYPPEPFYLTPDSGCSHEQNLKLQTAAWRQTAIKHSVTTAWMSMKRSSCRTVSFPNASPGEPPFLSPLANQWSCAWGQGWVSSMVCQSSTKHGDNATLNYFTYLHIIIIHVPKLRSCDHNFKSPPEHFKTPACIWKDYGPARASDMPRWPGATNAHSIVPPLTVPYTN